MAYLDKEFKALLQQADSLLREGELHGATGAVERLLENYSDRPESAACQARLAQMQGDWVKALSLWDAAISRSSAITPLNFLIARAQALFQLGRAPEVQQACFEIVQDPKRYAPEAISLLWNVTEKAKLHANLRNLVVSLEKANPNAKNTLMLRVRFSADCHEPDPAYQAFDTLLNRRLTLHDLNVLFEAATKIYEAPELKATLLRLLKLAGEMRAAGGTDSRLVTVLIIRLLLALDMPDRARQVLKALGPRAKIPLAKQISTMLNRRAAASYGDYLAPKIFCIGLSKTGTSSIADALQILGYQSLHWVNPVTLRLPALQDYLLFDAFSDICVSYRFELLYYLFPNSRFIYTQRPIGSWEQSFVRHFNFFGDTFQDIVANVARVRRKKYGAEWEVMHRTLYFNYQSPQEAYKAFDRRVEQFFSDKPDRLLTVNLFQGDGWNKLCAFVGKPTPEAKFPHSNRTI